MSAGGQRWRGLPTGTRFVGQAVALFALTSLLAAVASSTPLFVRAAAQGAWEQDRQRLSEVVLGATVITNTIVQSDGRLTVPERVRRVPALDQAIRAEGKDLGLRPPLALTALFDSVSASGPGGSGGVQVISRDGADREVRVLAGSASTDGALVPQSAARTLGASPGDVLVLRSEDGQVRVPVAGVYEDIGAPLPAYWEGLGDLFLPQPSPSGEDVRLPPPALILPQDEAVEVAAALAEPLRLNWFFRLPEGGPLASVVRENSRFQQLQLRLTAPERPAAALLDQVTAGAIQRTALPIVLDGVDDTVELLAPPVRAVGAGGTAAGLALAGAWAGLRARRREPELRALIARGISPARAARSALAEAAVPLVAGAAAGLGLGLIAVRLLGPVGSVPLERSALLWAAGAGTAAAATVAAVTATAAVRLGQVGVGAAQQALRRVPFVPVIGAVAIVAALPLLRPPAPDEPAQAVGLLTLVVPLLTVVAASAAVVGLLQQLAPRLRPRVDRLPIGPLLAFRRVMAAPGPTRLVVVSAALALGLVAYAGALGASTDRTVAVKAVVATGSDVVVELDNRQAVPPLPAGTMLVRRDSDVDVLPGEISASVLAIDTSRFADVAFWTDELADQSLRTLLAALDGYDGERVPVIVAGPLPPGVTASTGGELTLDSPAYQIPVQVVGRADAWPGMTSTRPLIVATEADLTAAMLAVERQLDLITTAQVWARGDAAAVVSSLEAAGSGALRPEDVRTAGEFRERPTLRAQGWALDYLRAVSAVAGVLGLVALGLHAAAQQRRRTVATVLLTRMGLSARSARRSAALELALLGGLAALLGAALTLPMARLLLVRLDPVPDLPPGPLFAVPGLVLIALTAGVAAAAVGGAVLVDGLARRIPGGEVMRGGE